MKLRTLLLCALAAIPASATPYLITVGTSGLTGTAGQIELQFNPGIGSLAGAATITGFDIPDGSLGTVDPAYSVGDYTGTLPGTVVINNTDVQNNLTQNLTFGSALSFLVDFSGPAATPPGGGTGGSVFTLRLYDASSNYLYATDSVNGTVVLVNLDTAARTTLGSRDTEQPEVMIEAIPEPATLTLFAAGALALAALARRRRA